MKPAFVWNFSTVINLVILPVVATLGVVGNLVTLLVMAITHLRPPSPKTLPRSGKSGGAMYVYITALRYLITSSEMQTV